jgi:aspartate/methionine/tyrosine aminotransferase
LYSKEEIMQLAELVKKHDLFLIADEVYREFTYDGAFIIHWCECPWTGRKCNYD